MQCTTEKRRDTYCSFLGIITKTLSFVAMRQLEYTKTLSFVAMRQLE
jgi:hypothetical protein